MSAMSKTAEKLSWSFAPRFRRGAVGWRSDPAIARIREAIAEIKAVSQKDPLLAADGAVLFLQKVSPALQNIDSSSGAIGNAVNRAIGALVPIIAKAPAEMPIRRKWLEQLYQAHADDAIPYIESLGDYWGELCASPDLAAEWADRLVDPIETMWSRGREGHGFFHATTLCLSALLAAGRHEQLLALLDQCPYRFWSYREWGVKALVAMGRKTEALHYAEACGPTKPRSCRSNPNPTCLVLRFLSAIYPARRSHTSNASGHPPCFSITSSIFFIRRMVSTSATTIVW